jgi:hypothetical protein
MLMLGESITAYYLHFLWNLFLGTFSYNSYKYHLLKTGFSQVFNCLITAYGGIKEPPPFQQV